jgi:hypothetical protein
MRLKLLLLGLFTCACLVVLNDRSSAQGPASSDDEATRIRIGFAVAPVPLSLRHKDPNLVGLGSYIVNTQSFCNDCHTSPAFADGHNPFAGEEPAKMNAAAYLAGGVNFGPVTSRNITPDKNGLPDGLTFPQFAALMHVGLDPDNLHPQLSPFLVVMPWPQFGKMTQHDLAAVYEYLRAIPSLPSAPGTPD